MLTYPVHVICFKEAESIFLEKYLHISLASLMTLNFWICFLLCNSFRYSLSHSAELILYLVCSLRPYSSAISCSALDDLALINTRLGPNHCYYPEEFTWEIPTSTSQLLTTAHAPLDSLLPYPFMVVSLRAPWDLWYLDSSHFFKIFNQLLTSTSLCGPHHFILSCSTLLSCLVFLLPLPWFWFLDQSNWVPSPLPHLSQGPAGVG